MKKSDLLVIYIYQLMSDLRKGKSSTISETDVFILLEMSEQWCPRLSVQEILGVFSNRSSEALLLFALVLAQQALHGGSGLVAEKARALLLVAVDEMPALQNTAVLEVLQQLQHLQPASLSA